MAVQPGEDVSPLRQATAGHIVAASVIIGALFVLVVPLAPIVLDLLLAANVLGAIICLLLTVSVPRPVEFTVFPALLLLSSLLRVVLSISATRLILSTGTGGAMIETFGRLVSGSELAVGVAFVAILAVALFVIVTSGAGRVAEVAARFALDAMPGKQMTVDADLSAGNIDAEQAQEQRRQIQSEADFYGAMDGASKFVRGDAIGAVVVIAIAFLGGLYVGTTRDGLSAQQAGTVYGMLAVGEGVVILFPALVVAAAAAIMVSRGAAATDLAADLGTQVLLQPAAAAAGGAALLVLATVPGAPKVPLVIVGLAALTGAWLLQRGGAVPAAADLAAASPALPATRPALAQPLQLELGQGLISLLVDDPQEGLLGEIARVREALTSEYGAPVPPAQVSDSEELDLMEYRVLVRGAEVARGKIMPSRLLAVPSPGRPAPSEGVPADERLQQPGAVWIRPEASEGLECELWTPGQVIAQSMRREAEARLGQFLGLEETAGLLTGVKTTHPAVLAQIEVSEVSRAAIRSVLQRLLDERVPITDLVGILEALADDASRGKSVVDLAEAARKSLAGTITERARRDGVQVRVVTLDPSLAEALWPTGERSADVVDPRLAQWLSDKLDGARDALEGAAAVVLCPPEIRPILADALRHRHPGIFVVSIDELLPNTVVDAVAEIGPPDWLPEAV